MKFNWGTKIAIFYTAFVLFILTMVYMSFGEKFDLVTDDYYAQEIAYQDKIDSKERLKELNEDLQISLDGEHLQIKFPHADHTSAKGKIHCFRPSDEAKDFIVDVNIVSGKQLIPIERFSKGKYLIKIDWMANEASYYSEQVIIIP